VLISEVVKKSFTTGFNIERYGLLNSNTPQEKIVEKEVEKIVEVIKEVGASNDKLVMLQDTLNKLRKELTDKNTKIQELEGTIKQLEQLNINQGAVYMKGSNLTKNI
jgi:predicted RNase H-like nuclease (RuvC/YqgF family)